jgi:tRNA dimethylallyltransferase
MNLQPPLKAVALVGATGTGKSSLAMQLAKDKDRCIISCDSMQVYRGLDIGTSKASKEEQISVRHALIDCTDVSHIWNAQIWADAAKQVIAEENAQGKLPIIVGGTGMYLKALTHGFADIPAEKEGVRSHFEALKAIHGTPYLHAKLAEVDAKLASRLKLQDTQRIIRGLCVYESTGIPLSQWHEKQRQADEDAKIQLECPVFVLEVPTEALRARIAERFHQMMDMGWLEEVKWLKSLDLPLTHPVMRAVGYRQLLDHLDGVYCLDEAIEKGITATRKYAKRQRTWFRNQTADAVRGEANTLKEKIEATLQQLESFQSCRDVSPE